MDDSALPYLWITSTLSILLGVGSVAAAWKLVFRSIPRGKPPASPTPTPPSESHLARVEADQAELFSTLEKLTTTVKRLSSRQGMRDVRERQSGEAPPQGTSKADLLRYYGMAGKVGPDFARAQMSFEMDSIRPN
jgi:hypothetical protein